MILNTYTTGAGFFSKKCFFLVHEAIPNGVHEMQFKNTPCKACKTQCTDIPNTFPVSRPRPPSPMPPKSFIVHVMHPRRKK